MKTKRKVATKIPCCFRVPSSAATVPAAAVLAAKKADSVVVIDGSDGEGEGEGEGKRKRKGKPVCHTDAVSAVPVVFFLRQTMRTTARAKKARDARAQCSLPRPLMISLSALIA